jgi:hypothetical protein
MAQSVILITHNDVAADFAERYQGSAASGKGVAAAKLQTLFSALAGGQASGSVIFGTGAAKATGTIAFSGVGAASDTVLVNGVTFTAVASGATGNQWNVGATAALSAASLAAAITASVTALVSGYVTADAASGTVTVSAARPGILGNLVTIAEGVDGSSHMTVSGARLTGGTAGTEVTSSYGV